MPSVVARIRHWVNGGSPKFDQQDKFDREKQDIIRWLAEQSWKSTRAGRCAGYKIGGFIGKPLKNEVRVKIGTLGVEKRDCSPTLSFGLAVVPNAYVSLLFGLAVGNVERQGGEETPRDERTLWTGSVSFGGNLDLAAILLKGAQSLP